MLIRAILAIKTGEGNRLAELAAETELWTVEVRMERIGLLSGPAVFSVAGLLLGILGSGYTAQCAV